ncbi:MAG: MarP family serine protease [Micrococcales bacterium]|nr:MarP family serine protease [Micrococcales bacterium]
MSLGAGAALDLALGVLLLVLALRGWRQGIVLGGLTLLGLLAGAVAGLALMPPLVRRFPALDSTLSMRIFALVVGVVVLASLGRTLGALLGTGLRPGGRRGAARTADAALGATLSVVLASVLVWFVAGAARDVLPTRAGRAVGDSAVLSAIDSVVPPGTARVFAGVREVLDREGFPRVFDTIRQEPIVPVAPPEDAVQRGPGARLAFYSVLKVTGAASECLRQQEGSGWVLERGRVVTNAHVVAGVDRPRVQVQGQAPVEARVVHFDPHRDIAVLSAPGLRAAPLQLGPELAPGDSAVVAGFPLNGPYRTDPARVRQVLTASGLDIYGRAGANREVYSLFTRVEQGNSGGPLLDSRGRVVGIVFARSLDDAKTGYALTVAEARGALTEGARAVEPVDTGACVRH